MATQNTTRSAEPETDDIINEHSKYNIEIRVQEATQFFGRQLENTASMDQNMFLPIDRPIPPGLTTETYHFLCHLRLIKAYDTPAEILVAQFACSALEAAGYEAEATILMPGGYPTSFAIQGVQKASIPGFSLMYCGSIILLAGQIGNGGDDIQGRVIVDAIAAFHHNNTERVRFGRARLTSMVIPCIAMVGTRPVFYKVPVTQALSDAVQSGRFPKDVIVVSYCGPPAQGGNVGMEDVEYRRICLQYINAFRQTARECWSKFTADIPADIPR